MKCIRVCIFIKGCFGPKGSKYSKLKTNLKFKKGDELLRKRNDLDLQNVKKMWYLVKIKTENFIYNTNWFVSDVLKWFFTDFDLTYMDCIVRKIF